MIDFGKLATFRSTDEVVDPREIFDRLPKPQNIDDLHDSQAKVLKAWFDNRNSKDTVIKLNTGGGKTLVGLLIAVSSANELGRGALYLVENKQLVHQVFEQARALGISAVEYSGRDSINASFKNGETILIASYKALFNGLSVFGVSPCPEPIETSAIIVDDAHSSFGTIRDTFTTTVYAEDDKELFRKLCIPFKRAFADVDRQGTFDEFSSGMGSNRDDVLEVPFWAWLDSTRYVSDLLSRKCAACRMAQDSTSQTLRFAWPLIKDELKYCYATISKDAFSIVPYLPFIDKFPTFVDSPRRVYMSATFSDDGAIMRTFSCIKASDLNVISPPTLAGIGRRMILLVENNEDTKRVIVSKMRALAKAGRGSVVLEPSFAGAEHWAGAGVEPIGANDVSATIEALRNGEKRVPVAFANRYNGIDLPGDACRLLVVSGMPTGMSDSQKLLSSTLSRSKLYARSIAQNIEQAIGRGTRGSGDYCVVILLGHDLCEWVKDEGHLQFFTPAAQAQIKCGEMITEEEIDSLDSLSEAIDQGVANDEGFASLLAGFMVDYRNKHSKSNESELERFAIAERKAMMDWRFGKPGKCVDFLLKFSSECDDDRSLGGYALHIAAQVEYAEGNREDARRLQEQAHSANQFLQKAAIPVPDSSGSLQARLILEMIKNGTPVKYGLLSRYDEETSALGEECDSTTYEMALEALGKYLGASSGRHDKNGEGGPDVLWVFNGEGLGIILEAKNEKKTDKPFTKDEHGQLLVSEQWFEDRFPNFTHVRVSVHPNSFAFNNASARKTYALTLDEVVKIRNDMRAILEILTASSVNRASQLSQCDALLDDYKLRGKQIIDDRATKFNVSDKAK